MLKYEDNIIRQEIMKELLNNQEDIFVIIEKYYPNWIEKILDKYSYDYEHLDLNWKKICTMIHILPKKIILVNFISFDIEYSILNKVCDFLTKNGYCVRRFDEFVICPVCNNAIPCKIIHDMMKSKNIAVPETWKEKCTNC